MTFHTRQTLKRLREQIVALKETDQDREATEVALRKELATSEELNSRLQEVIHAERGKTSALRSEVDRHCRENGNLSASAYNLRSKLKAAQRVIVVLGLRASKLLDSLDDEKSVTDLIFLDFKEPEEPRRTSPAEVSPNTAAPTKKDFFSEVFHG